MDCEQALAELEAFLDDELPAPARAQMERHLFGCASCFERGEFRRQVWEIVRRKCTVRVELPPEVAERIRGLIGEEPSTA
jgi:anti-sigma factor (TIGR02949 family)